jgi:hypothetical protein
MLELSKRNSREGKTEDEHLPRIGVRKEASQHGCED